MMFKTKIKRVKKKLVEIRNLIIKIIYKISLRKFKNKKLKKNNKNNPIKKLFQNRRQLYWIIIKKFQIIKKIQIKKKVQINLMVQIKRKKIVIMIIMTPIKYRFKQIKKKVVNKLIYLMM